MSASPEVFHPQNVTEIAQCWKVMPLARKDSGKGSSCSRLISGDASSSGDECNAKVRKPYTITKQRERWTESEHQKFLEALKLYGRAWRRIEEYIGTKTAVQIRSHAQKFFSKLEREASTGSSAGKVQDIEIPPPRPKRKPSHPYPKKAGNSSLNLEDENKEPSAVSAAGRTEVHHEGFQSGSFNPYISKGLGSGSAAFHRNPLALGHFFGPQGSMKLFGKTVVVPKNLKPAPDNNSSKECLFNGEFPFPNTQTIKTDLQQTSGFSPFSKVRKDENFSEEPLHSDRNGSCIVMTPSEGLDESCARNCSDSLAGRNECGAAAAADSHFLHEGEDQQQGGRVTLPQKGVKVDVKFPHGAQQNHSVQHWMDNFFRYHSGLPLPPMAGHGFTEGLPTNPLTYWQFMQASAVNYAAYTAAMAAAAAATGWTGSIAGRDESTETSQANMNKAPVLASLGNDPNPTALPSAVTSWWPFRGFMPSGYSPTMGAVHQGEQVDTAADAYPLKYGKDDADIEHISSQGGEHTMDLETADEAETSELDEDGKNKHTENGPSAKSGCTFGTSCVTEEPVCESAFPDSESQHEMDATIMPAKCSTQDSDIERRAAIESPQSLYSSSDEFDEQSKKQREGSSSGSNTPASRCPSSECEVPAMLESKKRDSYTLFENDDLCSDALEESDQLCGNTIMESPKVRVKHAEKVRKHQQKYSRHGGSDDSKRLKSCAHELELRKAVSQEGRKAFRALFTSKLLPQTFPAANMVEGRETSSRSEHVSRPTVSKKESDSIYVSVPMEIASGECISPDRSPRGEVNGEVLVHGNSSSTTNSSLEMGFGCGMSKEQHEGSSKNFTVSSSSGFVPYRRPPCTEAKIPEQPSSF